MHRPSAMIDGQGGSSEQEHGGGVSPDPGLQGNVHSTPEILKDLRRAVCELTQEPQARTARKTRLPGCLSRRFVIEPKPPRPTRSGRRATEWASGAPASRVVWPGSSCLSGRRACRHLVDGSPREVAVGCPSRDERAPTSAISPERRGSIKGTKASRDFRRIQRQIWRVRDAQGDPCGGDDRAHVQADGRRPHVWGPRWSRLLRCSRWCRTHQWNSSASWILPVGVGLNPRYWGTVRRRHERRCPQVPSRALSEPCSQPPWTSDSPFIRVQENRGHSPTRLFQVCPNATPIARPAAGAPYDTLAGQRFLISCRDAAADQFRMLLNWTLPESLLVLLAPAHKERAGGHVGSPGLPVPFCVLTLL